MAGCGNSSKLIFYFTFFVTIYFTFSSTSELGPDIYDSGCLNITNIDISQVVIGQMSDMYANREEMECKFALSMIFEFSVFHVSLNSFCNGCT
jgi:hypothetical protein